jgi:hypothetical protein
MKAPKGHQLHAITKLELNACLSDLVERHRERNALISAFHLHGPKDSALICEESGQTKVEQNGNMDTRLPSNSDDASKRSKEYLALIVAVNRSEGACGKSINDFNAKMLASESTKHSLASFRQMRSALQFPYKLQNDSPHITLRNNHQADSPNNHRDLR